ncbi:hypothetical protein M409DRAFT_69013 [Zasmidium cellare ATCC 36951]|uniref:BZIP domain-containing protein n=1 Tax=Zasmidium cellare ATCC 36951 TaxID=1080233 RepID=A0A6A6C6Q9_ZASCE|nr:uncharacterized protein M409DRAFT_69013 [Zasmidium cellare ATCC 36951]KAF2162731.1 hypothetical protein M409DRAFT_69013 [Zasmidium cellare ATCC 36951]
MTDRDPTATKSFWKSSNKADKNASQNNVTFVQQDPSGSGKRGERCQREMMGRVTTDLERRQETASANSSNEKRREQVYQAQKRHRNRKATYIHSLEAEIARLQSLDAQANVEKNALAHQNKAMKELLASHSLDFRLGEMGLEGKNDSGDGLSSLGSASIEVRPDEQLGGKDRTFLDFGEEMLWSTEGSSTTISPPLGLESSEGRQQQQHHNPDSWAAVDFILALEYPCQDHLPHHGINPAAKPMLMETEDSEGFTGHQLTMTSWVYDAAQQGNSHGHSHSHGHTHGHEREVANGAGEQKWMLPHTEIEKLITLSSNLPIDEEEITPAQAYSVIRDSVPSEGLLKPCLEALKGPLSGIVECRGFGTVMPTDVFRRYLGATLEGLGAGRS